MSIILVTVDVDDKTMLENGNMDFREFETNGYLVFSIKAK